MPSIIKLQNEIKGAKILSFSLGKKTRKLVKDIETQFNDLVLQVELFNKRFSDKGWIAYDKMSSTLIAEINRIYDEEGMDECEKALTTYYSTEVEDSLFMLKNGSEELSLRYNLILKAFEDHKAGRYYASVPLFLMIIDGAVNDYTKRMGFFAEGIDLNVWDCLVGCSDGLKKLKSIYCKGRYKTNDVMIDLPYRNGILHGRDLNYDNIFVSSKCLVLLFAIHDWIIKKKNEKNRKQKFLAEQQTKTWKELAADIQQNNENKKRIDEWHSRTVVIGKDIPEKGDADDYSDYDYIQKIVKMFEYWAKRNYGELSKLLKNMFNYEKVDKLVPKLCRELFQDKAFLSFRLLEIEERACSMRRVLVEVRWESNEKLMLEKLEFGLVYQGRDNKISIPYDENGDWVIMPWDVQGLYNE